MDRESRIRAALEGPKNGKYKSARAAAKAENVPRTTLQYRLKGGQETHSAHAYQQACTPGEEDALVEWVQRWHSEGFPISDEMLRTMTQRLILGRMDNSRRDTISTYITSRNWSACFIHCHLYLRGVIRCLNEVFHTPLCRCIHLQLEN
jgi:hypothetical protein